VPVEDVPNPPRHRAAAAPRPPAESLCDPAGRGLRRRLAPGAAAAAAHAGGAGREPQRHLLERLAGHPLRSLGQPLPGLRARLRLLLCPAGHAWLGLSPGLDFETRLFAKDDVAGLLRAELAAPGYRCAPIALVPSRTCTSRWSGRESDAGGARASRALRHPVTVVTKSALIERDLDLLAELARDGLVHAQLSVTTLRPDLARRLEPRQRARSGGSIQSRG